MNIHNLHRQNTTGINAPIAIKTGHIILLVSSVAYGSCTFGPDVTLFFGGPFFSSGSSISSSSSSSVVVPGIGGNFGTSTKKKSTKYQTFSACNLKKNI